MPVRQPQPTRKQTDTLIGIEESELWSMADALRGSMSSNQSGEGETRRDLIEADLVDCMVALPGQLFYSTQNPACLWFLSRDRGAGADRDRHGETLFVDAREFGSMVDRMHRALTREDIDRIADTYHRWRGTDEDYKDEPGFCRSVPLDELRRHDLVLTPGRYVGAAPVEDDREPFADKMRRLVAELHDQQADGARLDAAFSKNLAGLGFAAPGTSKR